ALFGLLAGLVLRSATRGESLLFPHLTDILTPRGFDAYPFNGGLPEGVLVPDNARALLTVLAILGAALLVLGVAALLSRGVIRGPLAIPLLFGLIALGLTEAYQAFSDRYLLMVAPSAIV